MILVFTQISFVWCLALRVSCYDDDHLPDGYHYQKAFPEDIMVDVINNFGLALLEAHNEGNEDNMALSPYGATSVLVALKEGLRGYAAREIETSIHLPADLSVIRIGLRDVHRHLKSYFIPKEGFLAGLTLSNDKVELLRNYEDILRFYAYDLESFNNPLYPDVFEGITSPTGANTTPVFEMTTEKMLTTITLSVTPETTVGEEHKNVSENAIGTTEDMQTTSSTEREGESLTTVETTSLTEYNRFVTTAVESAGLTVEDSRFVTTARADDQTTSSKGTTIRNQVTKIRATSFTLPPTTREENKVTTEPAEDMETMSTIAKADQTTRPKATTILSLATKMETSPTSLPPTTREENKVTTEAAEDMKTVSTIAKADRTTGPRPATIQNLAAKMETSSTSLPPTTRQDNKVTTEAVEDMETMLTIGKAGQTTRPKATTIQNLATKMETSPTSLPPKKIERTTRAENQVTTEKAEDVEITSSVIGKVNQATRPKATTATKIATSSTILPRTTKEENQVTPENMQTISSITLPMKTSTAKTDEVNEETTITPPSTLSINTLNTVGTNTVVTTTATPMQMELTTSLEEDASKSNPSDAVTAESHHQVDSTSFVGASEEESATDVTVTTITTSTSSKFGQTNKNTQHTEVVTKSSEATTTTFEEYSSEEDSYGDEVDSTESSTDNEINSEGTSTAETTEDYDYSTEGNKTRRARSLVDYLIARHHDSFHASNDRKGRRHYGYDHEYEPQESMSFLIYGRIREPNIDFMNYDAVLPFAYLPELDALALSFPLDSSEYYLLLLLPVEANGIDTLIYDLKRSLSLREIISSLNFTHVKAVIPSFMLKGYVILTSTLQKLGVRKIFEPRHADFSLMTEEPNLYVTNIEQSVTVTIRNYIDPEKLPSHRNLQDFRTVEFKADHPFLYFVMDSRIHVTLMAGKIVNPLNSRIR